MRKLYNDAGFIALSATKLGGPELVPVAQQRCKGTKADGEPCRAWSAGESGYCVAHDPDKRAEMQKARRRGGHRRQAKAAAQRAAQASSDGAPPPTEPAAPAESGGAPASGIPASGAPFDPPRNLADLRTIVGQLIVDTRKGLIGAREATALASLTRTMSKLLEDSEPSPAAMVSMTDAQLAALVLEALTDDQRAKLLAEVDGGATTGPGS